ncbi:MAG: glycoside hydrolase family 3 protein [Microthrixaceae bacterium]
MTGHESDATEATVEELLDRLDLDERSALTAGVGMWRNHAVERVGLPPIKMTDGPVGARGDRFVGTTSALTPCSSALGATWDPPLVEEVGRILGGETRAKRAHVLLAPTVNLHRHPFAGRNFECFSEDPYLTARLAVGFVRGVQSTGVGACIKHFVANDSEYQRHTISSDVDERTLRELYLVPFEAAVAEADVAAVMSAYNRLNGTYCAEHHWLLVDLLKTEWGFRGAVISDWWGAQSPASAEGGLDLEMPGPPIHLGTTSAARVRDGGLDAAVVEEQARRLLRLAGRTGALTADERPESSEEAPGAREVLRRAGAAAVVLLRNEPVAGTPVLPLELPDGATLAVVGPNAAHTMLLGGGSATVNPHHSGSVLDGLRDHYGDRVRIVHEPGPATHPSAPPVPPAQIRPAQHEHGASGLTLEYFPNRELDGPPTRVEGAAGTRLNWIDDDAVPAKGFSVRATGTFTAEVAGDHTFTLVTAGTGTLRLGGELLLDNRDDPRPGTAFFGLGTEEIRGSVHLDAGEEIELVCEYASLDGFDMGGLQVGYLPPVPADAFDRAVAAAAAADAVICVVGMSGDSESEGHDRATLALPGGQDDLVRAVVAANPRTAVVVNAGAPVDLAAAADAPALVMGWYLGQETPGATADVLTGTADPGGRLPTTFGRRVEDWTSDVTYPGDAGHVLYGEQLFMGYRGFDRRGVEPAFCFGHGGSYTTFDWGPPVADRASVDVADLDDGTEVVLRLPVRNTGGRAGSDVVQCYVADVASTLLRPEQELRAFAKVHLAPGEEQVVELRLGARAFAAWDPGVADTPTASGHGAWVVEPGAVELRVARSSRDVHAVVPLDITGPAPPAGPFG